MTERGRILRDTNAGPGLVTISGRQYTFSLESMWHSDVPPRVGMYVDATLDSMGAPAALYAISDTQIAKEQAQRALSDALQRGRTLQGGALKQFSVAVVLAELLLLLAFFLLPNVRLGSGVMGEAALSGWDASGLNPAGMMTNDHGLLSLFCLVCLLAPLAVPFLQRAPWSRWLYVAPILGTLVNLFSVFSGLARQSRAATSAIGNVFGAEAARSVGSMNQPSLAMGSYIVLLAALYLATRSVRKPSIEMPPAAVAAP